MDVMIKVWEGATEYVWHTVYEGSREEIPQEYREDVALIDATDDIDYLNFPRATRCKEVDGVGELIIINTDWGREECVVLYMYYLNREL